MSRNPNHAVNEGERIRDRAFNRFARKGDYETYYKLVNASLGPIVNGETVDWQKELYGGMAAD